MSKTPHPLRRIAFMIALFAVLHFGLLHWLAGTNVVSTLFSAGKHTPIGSLVLALVFILVRIVTVLILPASVLSQLVSFAMEKYAKEPPPSSAADNPPSTTSSESK